MAVVLHATETDMQSCDSVNACCMVILSVCNLLYCASQLALYPDFLTPGLVACSTKGQTLGEKAWVRGYIPAKVKCIIGQRTICNLHAWKKGASYTSADGAELS